MSVANAIASMQTPRSRPDAGHGSHSVYRRGPGVTHISEADQLARETPVALQYNGISHATLLATPCDLTDFAYGFSFTEGVIRSAADIYDIEIEEQVSGIVLQVEIASACLAQLKQRRRNLAGRTGCGLCGLESLDEVQRKLPPVQAPAPFITEQAIANAVQALRQLQPLHLITGATHAAGWADGEGSVLHVREDVGRHNALDKLIGHLIRNGIDTATGFAVISSRASFEMVQKSAAAGISVLVAVSAPTTYAVKMAQELNILLAGFARKKSFTVYTHPEHLSIKETPL